MAAETPEPSSTTARPPVHLPTYLLGDEGKPNHFTATTSRESAATEAKSLSVGDAAFIKRSDLKWTYAVVTEKVEEAALGSAPTILRFEVDKDGNRKSFPEAQWGKYIRVIKVEEVELADLEVAAADAAVGKAQDEVSKAEEELTKVEEAVKPEEAPKDDASKAASVESEKKEDDDTKSVKSSAETAIKTEVVISSAASTGGDSIKSTKSTKSKGSKSAGGSSWFSGLPTIFGGASSKKPEDASSKITEESSKVPSVVSQEGEEMTASIAATSVVATETPDAAEFPIQDDVAAEPMKDDPAAAALANTSFPTFAEHAASVDEASVTPSAAPTPEAAPEAAPQAPAPAAAKEEPNNTKENSDPISDTTSKLVHHPVFLPSPKAASAAPDSTASATSATSATASSTSSVSSKEKDTDSSKLRNPLNLKKTLSLKKKSSIVNRMFSKNKDKDKEKNTMPKVEEKKTVTMQSSPMSPTASAGADPKSPKMAGDKKEWFDPEACEVDYDKNPTDLFQALEARQFDYADEMFVQVNTQFTKECKTWVVARGQKKKDSQLRFRALPLHAALVFGAPDAMIMKILNSYPKATRGRDVKGRLPIHLAMEHNASEEIVASILEAFPKGFFAKDKKDMTPLDYVNGNMDRAHMKKYMPLLTAAKVEDERIKWEIEKEESLEEQRARLKNDPVYMEDVIEKVTEKVETTYSNKMGLLETNYQKEIQLLKKKHDSETQALLEGFEVKLNFERKLQKLKAKA
mmetsp:Transcript_11892/g.21985  ORF Transcript_11892/g.21985 Transcript_11892/m.21985 type:complete len:748 (-) Transcript_11892:263-2506(-)|eukprot:CAMPEP_0201866636 /NCGR_PEP_ID=MMETSP0902-20130614/1145_1 /ASSEMBLY_ACC=CAM_ASM_000551 /TAXON_ID=420261 /ORGANISM="Thalassiosira antarctica, Strain CCMP982" /LENGTH=747 /DNA_ID=CAMNT_0048391641 /DNA_START=35 /DNA_END=2278 /DNA_ORIENTATION=-